MLLLLHHSEVLYTYFQIKDLNGPFGGQECPFLIKSNTFQEQITRLNRVFHQIFNIDQKCQMRTLSDLFRTKCFAAPPHDVAVGRPTVPEMATLYNVDRTTDQKMIKIRYKNDPKSMQKSTPKK